MKLKVAIIGRPNVGKSSIFNRLIKYRKSIVDDLPGVTRDRLYEKVVYNNEEFILIDTGGITLDDGDFNKEIKVQAEIAIDESDLILFVVDAQIGVTKDDEIIMNILNKSNKQVVVVANKVDNQNIKDDIYELYSLGFETIIPVSAVHGIGMYDILDYITQNHELAHKEEYQGISFSIIGRPNVGKSTLFNALIGEEKSIVSNIEGTTRDTVDTYFEKDGIEYKMIDTAGIRKRGKIYEKIEKYSILRALKVIERSDIILWVLDAEVGLIEQDKRVLGYAFEEKKPIIVIVNKWDKISKETNTQRDFQKNIQDKMPFIKDSEFIFTSALNGKGISKILATVNLLYQKYTLELPTSRVNNVLNEAVFRKSHPTHKGQPVRFYYASQIDYKPPKFVVFVNNKKLVHFSYERYLKNYFKKSFGLEGINIDFVFKNRNEE